MTFPDFDPVLVHLGPVAIRWYALAYVAGILAGWRYGAGLTRDQRLWRGAAPTATDKQVDDFVLWLTVGIIVGGRVGYMLFYDFGTLVTRPLELFQPWHGGMSFHGGLIGVTVAIVGFSLGNRIDVIRLADLTAPCVPIGLFFGRLANFLNGELWGRPTHLPWGMVFCNAHIRAAYAKVLHGDCPAGMAARHPSQLYEASLEGVTLFLILRWATHGAKWLPRRGAVTGLFLACYGLFRISLENVREPDAGMPDFPFGLTMGMMLSGPMVLAGLGLIAWSRRPQNLAALAVAAAPVDHGAPVDEPPEAPTDPSQAMSSGAGESTSEGDVAARPA